jgi:hypothetical protein
MKKATILAFFGLLAFILIAAPVNPIAVYATSLNTFWVWPSGDESGETDWSNIMAAFEQAVVSGPGSTVRFAAGDFYVHRPIQVANFSGTVAGQGKEVTRLHTAPGRLFGLLEYPLPPYPTYMELYLDSNWPADQTADITVSDLSFYIDGPSEPWSSHDPRNQFNNMNVVDVRGIHTGYLDPNHANFELTHLNVTFQHLKAVADTGPQYLYFGSSILNCFQAFGEWVIQLDPDTNTIFGRWIKPITGTYIFEDIEMYDSAWLNVVGARDSVIRIGGSKENGIVVRSTGYAVDVITVGLMNISNSTVEVSYLDASGVDGGVYLLQGADAAWGNDLGELVPESLPEPSSFVFQHNRISSEYGGWYTAFELWNAGGELGQSLGNVVISNNKINVVDHEPPFEGIFSYFVDSAQVTNNRISGRGVAGIWVEPYGTPANGWLLQGNNLNTFDAEFAQIYLGTGTSNCTVVGGNTRGNVFDEGINNILVGVNNQGGNPPGPTLRDALEQKREAIKALP